jgi:hypothetical protein
MPENGDNDEYEGINREAYAQGWRREFKEAIDAALEEAGVPVGDTALIDYIEVKRVRRNPIHDYRVVLR